MKMFRSIDISCWFDFIWLQSQGFSARKITSKSLKRASIFSKLQANENIRGGFSLLVTLKSWLLQDCPPNFSSKGLWCSPVPLKFESYNLQHCKKNCRKLIFYVLPEQLLSQIILGRLHCYDVTLMKKYNKLLLQKSETKISKQKRFHKELV